MTSCPTINNLKSKYPRPVAFDFTEDDHKGFGRCYCVGGALMRAQLPLYKKAVAAITGYPMLVNFPHYLRLAETLRQYNPELNGTAYEFARKLIEQNDAGNFDGAWDIACKALEWTPDAEEDPEEETANG